MANSSAFIYFLRPSREGLAETPTPEEEARLEEHFRYLRSQLEQGRLVLAGPCLDGTIGVVIFRAETEEAARQFMEGDPRRKPRADERGVAQISRFAAAD